MTEKGPGNVEAAETAARGTAQEKYGAHLRLTERVYDFVGMWSHSDDLRPSAEVSLAEQVCVALLYRLANDLRGVQELAIRGYSLQAVSLAASMFEGAYTLAFIGNNDALAREWVDHKEPTHTFRPAKTLVEEVVKKEKEPDVDAATKARYLVYTQLCLAKHVNPRLQRQHGISQKETEESRVTTFFMGPDVTSDAAIRASWFALGQAADLVLMGFSAYVREIVGSDKLPQKAREEMREMAQRLSDLRKSAIERWGTVDPVQGKL